MRPTRSDEGGSGQAATPQFSNASGLVAIGRYGSVLWKRSPRSVLAGIVVCVVAGVAVFKHADGAKQSGNTQGMPTQAALADSGGQDQTATPIAASQSRGSFVPTSARKPDRSNTPETSRYFPSKRADARYAGQSSKVAATPEQLWASVEAGNSQAAVALADRYMRGDGVPVNCNQARVLLLVASQRNNTEAIKKLPDLDKTGCPANPH